MQPPLPRAPGWHAVRMAAGAGGRTLRGLRCGVSRRADNRRRSVRSRDALLTMRPHDPLGPTIQTATALAAERRHVWTGAAVTPNRHYAVRTHE
jgi:hypothetical protein